jgi:hypothetical protein
MKLSSNLLSILGFPLSLALLGVALYIKKPDARDFIDRRFPWVRETVGKHAPPFEVKIVRVAPFAIPPPIRTASEEASMKNGAPPRSSITPPLPPEPSAPMVVAHPFDLDKVCEDSARWPKTVRLKAPVEFPAVINGKVAGKLLAPAGAEARVMRVSSAKVGVEYHGGGAWLDFERTDFVERARLAWH